jgi:SAM-dependent methyltransferase
MPMTSARPSGTEGYAEEAEQLLGRYESITFEVAQAPVLHLIPTAPSRILDIGAGTGRDAAALAARGYSVVAAEPTAALRLGGMARHTSPRIEWIDDSLPLLAVLRARGEAFDLVMLTAVWMHLDEAERRTAMPAVASLVRAAGTVLMSLRHGPVPRGRRMFDVTAEETVRLAEAHDLGVVFNRLTGSVLAGNEDVTWTRLAFTKR